MMTEGGENLWSLSKQEIFAKFSTSERGLAPLDVQERTAKYGLNRLTPKPPPPLWRIYLRQFQNSLILVLLAAVGLILVVWLFERQSADLTEAGLILAIILTITLVGCWLEAKAQRTLQALLKVLAPTAVVIRDGRQVQISAEQ
ncbi:MAG: cation-transporting P-type ATPase [Patescibacteria group bacterium]